MRLPIALSLFVFLSISAAETPASKVTHTVFVAGAETEILSDGGEVLWKYPAATRDGFVLPDGHLLLAVSKNKDYPGGGVVEVTRENQTVFAYKGTQVEVNTAQALANGRIMLTEAGSSPRVLEVERTGKIVVEVPLQAQTGNAHLQTRMTRQLPNGNYLVPQVMERAVREYTPAGQIV